MSEWWVCDNDRCAARRDALGRCLMHGTCREGWFRRHVHERVGDLGKWTIRSMAAHGNVAPSRATLRGTKGVVEVYGGFNHANEVWFYGKDGSEVWVARHWEPSTLRDAVLAACALAGVQLPLGARP